MSAVAVVAFTLILANNVLAESSSPNYQMVETDFGGGAAGKSCSDQYCARVSIGSVADDKNSTSGSSAQFDPEANEGPLIEVIVDAGESNLGVLSTSQTATKTTIVRVRQQQSSGYLLQIVGSPPKIDKHTIATPSAPTASRPGTEQFGINLVANTSPNIGSQPIDFPAEGNFGLLEDNYAVQNMFMYKNEDIIARSLAENGRTDYTLSMIVNVSNSTPAGKYTGDYAVLVIPYY